MGESVALDDSKPVHSTSKLSINSICPSGFASK